MNEILDITIINSKLKTIKSFDCLDSNFFNISYNDDIEECFTNNKIHNFYVIKIDTDTQQEIQQIETLCSEVKKVSPISVVIVITKNIALNVLERLPNNCEIIDENIDTKSLQNVLIISNIKAKRKQQVNDSNTLYQIAIENCMQSVVLLDQNLKIFYVNNAFCKLLELSSAQLAYGKSLDYFFSETNLSYIKTNIIPNLSSQETWNSELILSKKESNPKSKTYTQLGLSSLDNGHYIACINDISEQKRTILNLQNQRDKYKNFYENSNEGHYQCKLDGSLIIINPKLVQMLGYFDESPLFKMESIFQLYKNSKKRKEKLDILLTSKLQQHNNYETQMLCQDESTMYVLENIQVIVDSNKNPLYFDIITRDITQQKKNEDKLYNLAYTDTITNLPNRICLQKDLFALINNLKKGKTTKEFALLSGNIDNFRIINNSLGPNNGDLLMNKIANRLNPENEDDYHLYKTGGDEFSVLLKSNNIKNETPKILKKLISSFDFPFFINNHKVFIKGSIGVVYSDMNYDFPEYYMRAVDTTISQVKFNGGAHWKVFSENMFEKAFDRLIIEEDIRDGLNRNDFIVYYQAIICSKTKKIVGAEALSRWVHKSKGLISPDQYISIAEETGLIIKLGKKALYDACNQAKQWHNAGYNDFFISVNLSMKQIEKKDIVTTIRKALEETQLDPSKLKLEITESLAMLNLSRIQKILSELISLGVQFSVDDFGTGYSSLAYIHQLPFHNLKIDRIFVKRYDNSKINTMVEVIQALAKSLDLNVIAEGVETHKQFELLQEQGCSLFQGYYFSKPISKDDFTKLLKTFDYNLEILKER